MVSSRCAINIATCGIYLHSRYADLQPNLLVHQQPVLNGDAARQKDTMPWADLGTSQNETVKSV